LVNQLIALYLAAEDWTMAEELFGQVKEPNVSNYVGLMTHYNHVGKWPQTLQLYDQLKGQRRIQPDVATYMCALTAVKQSKQIEKGKEIETDIIKQNIWQNHVDLQRVLKETLTEEK
jgi:hypothetical protein